MRLARMGTILIIDDNDTIRDGLAITVKKLGHDPIVAANGKAGIEAFKAKRADFVITDLKMDGATGVDVLKAITAIDAEVPIMIITGFGTVETAVEAMKLGAFDFITKPFQLEEILLRVRNALEKRRLKNEVHLLRAEAKSAFGFEGIVGVSEAFREIVAALPKVGQTDSTVLITGESGTGKELIARAIHFVSRRAQGPFISISGAALPEQLLENELFGHVRGAFTGALAARKGLLEEAQGGTFFLDEIGETPLAIQTKLLRVLEERSVRRLGDNRAVPVDIRIVAATNRNLEAAVRERVFREDLLYRLNVIHLHLPPLRNRMEDVPLLARHFLAAHARRAGRPLEGISPAAIDVLSGYRFPGNVRELSNVIEQAVALAPGPLIEPRDLPERLLRPATEISAPRPGKDEPHAPLPEDIAGSAEQEHLLVALRQTDWNISRAAARLGISRNTLRYRIEKYHLQP
jgi:DNA-binding NtrC family response regulator